MASTAGTVLMGLSRIRDHTLAAWSAVHAISAIGGLAVLVLVQIPWLSGAFEVVGLTNSETIRTTIVAVVLTAIFSELARLSRKISQSEQDSRRHFRDAIEAYPFLMSFPPPTNSEMAALDILGVNLNSIWPIMAYWIQRPEASGHRIRIAALQDPHDRLTAWVPQEWSDDAKTHIASARETAEAPEIRERGIVLEVYEYDFLPAVRGARLGNGDLLISLMSWQGDGRAAPRGYGCEYIPYSERTPSADAMRQLFDSWFTRAMQSTQVHNGSVDT